MNTATIITAWAGDGSDASPFHPALLDDYPGIASYTDITGQPAANLIVSPNAFTVEVTVDDATLAAIQGDADYVVLTAEAVTE